MKKIQSKCLKSLYKIWKRIKNLTTNVEYRVM